MLEELRGFLAPSRGDVLDPSVRAVPGEGLNIPIWLLGSSDFSAQLAGYLGLPFAFAGQFAAENTQIAFSAYRRSFQASTVLEEPFAMLGVNIVAADTDGKAEYLSTTSQQKYLQMVRGRIHLTQMMGPVESMEDLYWDEREKFAVEGRLQGAIVGGPDVVREKLQALMEATQADELIIQSEVFHHPDRLRSYEIIAAAARA
jgi:luciferase family oxidoreductase group 1